jgi:hypothetical protein
MPMPDVRDSRTWRDRTFPAPLRRAADLAERRRPAIAHCRCTRLRPRRARWDGREIRGVCRARVTDSYAMGCPGLDHPSGAEAAVRISYGLGEWWIG